MVYPVKDQYNNKIDRKRSFKIVVYILENQNDSIHITSFCNSYIDGQTEQLLIEKLLNSKNIIQIKPEGKKNIFLLENHQENRPLSRAFFSLQMSAFGR